MVGVVLLLGVEFFGETSKCATRWLNLGVTRIQPSEMMKIAVPMMLAWYFQRHEGAVRIRDFLAAAAMLAAPFGLIVLQPDLGTALLVFGAGFFVIYFAGLSFKLLVPVMLAGIIGIGTLVYYEDQLCEPDVNWVVLHDYQKHRVCTLLNPSSDPLGKGFHTIQSMIAVGSGGVYGKGYMKGTQTHLDFIPERTTDFIFAVYAEEFGLYGGIAILVLYGLMMARGLTIASRASSQFGRLLSGALTMMLFIYVFVNVGIDVYKRQWRRGPRPPTRARSPAWAGRDRGSSGSRARLPCCACCGFRRGRRRTGGFPGPRCRRPRSARSGAAPHR